VSVCVAHHRALGITGHLGARIFLDPPAPFVLVGDVVGRSLLDVIISHEVTSDVVNNVLFSLELERFPLFSQEDCTLIGLMYDIVTD